MTRPHSRVCILSSDLGRQRSQGEVQRAHSGCDVAAAGPGRQADTQAQLQVSFR